MFCFTVITITIVSIYFIFVNNRNYLGQDIYPTLNSVINYIKENVNENNLVGDAENLVETLTPTERRVCEAMIPCFVFSIHQNPHISAKDGPVIKDFLCLAVSILSHFIMAASIQYVLININLSFMLAGKVDKFTEKNNANNTEMVVEDEDEDEENKNATIKQTLIHILRERRFTARLVERIRNVGKPATLWDITSVIDFVINISATNDQTLLESLADPFVTHLRAIDAGDKVGALWKRAIEGLSILFLGKGNTRLSAAWNAIAIHAAEVFLSLTSFDSRVQGLDILETISKEESIARWIKENRVLMRVLKDVSAHIEFVKRSKDLIKNIAETGQLDEEMVDHIMLFCTNETPKDVREAMLDNVNNAAKAMSIDALKAFDRAFARFSPEEFADRDVSAVVVCIARSFIPFSTTIKEHRTICMCMNRLMENAMDNEINENNAMNNGSNEDNAMNNENNEDNAMNKESSEDNTMCVEGKQNVEQHITNAGNRGDKHFAVDKKAAVDTLTNVFLNFIPNKTVLPYLAEFVENVRNHKSSWQSCLIASKIMEDLKALPAGCLDLFDFMIQDMEHFKLKVAAPHREEIRQRGSSNFVIPGTSATYKEQVAFRLEALKRLSLAFPMQLTSDRVCRVWDVYVQDPIVPEDPETLMTFFMDTFTGKYFSNKIYKILLSEKVLGLDFGALTSKEAMFIMYLIKNANIDNKSFVYNQVDNKWIIPNHKEFIGLGIIWSIALGAIDNGVACSAINFFKELLDYVSGPYYPTDVAAAALRKLDEGDDLRASRLLSIIAAMVSNTHPQGAQANRESLATAENYKALYSVLKSDTTKWETKVLCAHVLHVLPFDKYLEDKVRAMLSEKGSDWDRVFGGGEKEYFFIKYALLALDCINLTEEALLESGLAEYLALRVFQRFVDKSHAEYLDLCAKLVDLFNSHSATVIRTLHSEDSKRMYVKNIFDLVYICLHNVNSEYTNNCLVSCKNIINNIYSNNSNNDNNKMEVELDASFMFGEGRIDEKWLCEVFVKCPCECIDTLANLLCCLFTYINDVSAKNYVLKSFLSLANDPEVRSKCFSFSFVKFLEKQTFDYPTLEGILASLHELLTKCTCQEVVISCDTDERSTMLTFFAYKVSKELLKHADEGGVADEWVRTERGVANTVLNAYLFGEPIPKCQSDESRFFGFGTIRNFIDLWVKRGMEQDTQHIRYILGVINEQTGFIGLSEDAHYVMDTKINAAYPKCAGINNLGSTCYMNSMLQQLYMIPAFRDGVLRLDLTGHEDGYLWELQKLFSRMQDGCKAYVSTKDFVKTIEINGERINPRVQMDAMEFLETAISKTAEEAKKVCGTDFVNEIFGYKSCSQLIPKTCAHINESSFSYTSISMDVKGKAGLLDSLGESVKGDMLVGDNKYKCEQCGEKQDTLKRTCFLSTPNVLVVQCKRFDFDYNRWLRFKIDTRFEFPMSFSIYPYTKEGIENPGAPATEDYDYDLVGVVMHHGDAEAGHYYSYIKDRDGDNGWITFNDRNLTPFSVDSIEDKCYGGKPWSAYVLFYQKRTYAWAAPASRSEVVSPTRRAFLEEVNDKNKLLMKSAALFSDGFVGFVEDLFLVDGAPLSSAMDLKTIWSYFLYIVPYVGNKNGNPSANIDVWRQALENACKTLPDFPGGLFSGDGALLQHGLVEMPEASARGAFASVVAAKLSTLKGAAQDNAVAACFSLLGKVSRDWKYFSELFSLYIFLENSVQGALDALLRTNTLVLLVKLMLPEDDPMRSRKDVHNKFIGAYANSLVGVIAPVVAANTNGVLSIPGSDKDMLFQPGFYETLASHSPLATAKMLNLLVQLTEGEDGTRNLVNCLRAAIEVLDTQHMDAFFTELQPLFEGSRDELTSLRTGFFMDALVDIGKNTKKKDLCEALLNAAATKLADPIRFPAVADWILANIQVWLRSFILASQKTLRDSALKMLFRAVVGCDDKDLVGSNIPLDAARAERLRTILKFTLDNFANLTKVDNFVSAKFLQLSNLLVACARPEVCAAGLVTKEHVDALMDFVAKLNVQQSTRKETLWAGNPKYFIAEFLTAAARISGGETIADYIADSQHFGGFLCFVSSRDTLSSESPADADRPIEAMCAVVHLVLSKPPAALMTFLLASETFEWLLSRVLFTESVVAAAGAKAAVADLVCAILMTTANGLGPAVAKKLASVFTNLRVTPLDYAISTIEGFFFTPSRDGIIPAASISAFCGGGVFRFVRESLRCQGDRLNRVKEFAFMLFSVISTREDKAECLQECEACKEEMNALALDVFFMDSNEDESAWSLLAQLIPDRRCFMEALWERLVAELPQGHNARNSFADSVIEEEAKGGDEKSVLVLMYIAVFFGASGNLSVIEKLATPLIAQKFVSELFNSRAAQTEKHPDHVVEAMKKVVALVPNRGELALSFDEAIKRAPQETPEDKKVLARRQEMLLTYFADELTHDLKSSPPGN